MAFMLVDMFPLFCMAFLLRPDSHILLIVLDQCFDIFIQILSLFFIMVCVYLIYHAIVCLMNEQAI
jgi:hypothetical protein